MLALAGEKGHLSAALREDNNNAVLNRPPIFNGSQLLDIDPAKAPKGYSGPVRAGPHRSSDRSRLRSRHLESLSQLPHAHSRPAPPEPSSCPGASSRSSLVASSPPSRNVAGGGASPASTGERGARGGPRRRGDHGRRRQQVARRRRRPGLPRGHPEGIVEVHFNGDTVVFDGKHAGATSVVLVKRNGFEVTYIINVFLRDPKAVEAELIELLEGYTGVRPRRVGRASSSRAACPPRPTPSASRSSPASTRPRSSRSSSSAAAGADRTVNVRIDFYFVQYDRSSSYGVGITYPSQFGAGTYSLAITNPPADDDGDADGRDPCRAAPASPRPSRRSIWPRPTAGRRCSSTPPW